MTFPEIPLGWITTSLGAVLFVYVLYQVWQDSPAKRKKQEVTGVPVFAGVFIVQHIKHTFYWHQGCAGEMQPFHPEITVPREARIILQVEVRITAPSC